MRKLYSTLLLCTFAVGAFSSCKEDEFVFFQLPRDPVAPVSSTIPIKQVISENHIDILWVIDNSGSMGTFQREVIDNTELFMQEFTKDKYLSWAMGLISTDDYDAPYIGFTPQTLLNSKSANPVVLFQQAVSRLGIYGSGIEEMYNPTEQALNRYPGFLSQSGYLALITVTDAPEQSARSTQGFLSFLIQKKGSIDRVFSYGAYGADDLGCTTGEGWNYTGSKYAELTLATKGKYFPLCSDTFGTDLAALGKDLVKRVTQPMIRLERRPKVSTIRLSYKGRVLPGGPKEDGGFWIYDFELNALVLHDLEFAPSDTESVELTYSEDDGLP